MSKNRRSRSRRFGTSPAARRVRLRDIEVLASVARYYTLTRGQINRLHFPSDHDGRITRKRLRLLHEEGLVNRTNMQVVNPAMGAPAGERVLLRPVGC